MQALRQKFATEMQARSQVPPETLDVVLFPDAYRRPWGVVHSSVPLLVTGLIEMDSSRAEPLFRAELHRHFP